MKRVALYLRVSTAAQEATADEPLSCCPMARELQAARCLQAFLEWRLPTGESLGPN